MHTSDKKLPPLITALMQQDIYAHPVERLQLIETHISWVILTGQYAYKIKKPVNVGFLDFSSLEKRHFYCLEEVRLNRRLAADIYLEVVPITGSHESPHWAGDSDTIEYAVKMMQFPQQAQLDRMLMKGNLSSFQLDSFANLIADFHQQTDIAGEKQSYGEPKSLYFPIEENFIQIRAQLNNTKQLSQLNNIEGFCQESFRRLLPIFEQRKNEGFIRECHGDLHLANMAWVREKPLLFDCIEFSPNLRWIDVINEVAFLMMDLQKNDRSDLAWRFLNGYLELTGDYSGVRVLSFYLIYRAIVRAKIEIIQAGQSKIGDAKRTNAENAFQQYLLLGKIYTQTNQPRLIITHGFSASGKSTLSRKIAEQMGAIRIRSDVERKRLFGMQAKDDGKADIDQSIYSPEASQKIYKKLVQLTEQVLLGGISVIVDAACLKTGQREDFRRLAKVLHCPFLILDIPVSKDVLRQRIKRRKKGASDADLAVLENQFLSTQPLTLAEETQLIRVDSEAGIIIDALVNQINSY